MLIARSKPHFSWYFTILDQGEQEVALLTKSL